MKDIISVIFVVLGILGLILINIQYKERQLMYQRYLENYYKKRRLREMMIFSMISISGIFIHII